MYSLGVIPARYGSTRFPGKPLALIKGVPLIERVWRQVAKSRLLDTVVVATDDERIVEAVRKFGGTSMMTSPSCRSGTDRLAEVARAFRRKDSVVVNIQGDEPLISPLLIDRLVRALEQDRSAVAVTAVHPLRKAAEIESPHVVKAVVDREFKALYFSRAAIPFRRSNAPVTMYKHLGIYGYRREFLLRFASWPQGTLEKAEQLEQLRILERGYTLKVVVSPRDSFGVDVPSDIRKIERLLR